MWVECFAVMWSGVNDVEGNAYNDGGGTLVCRQQATTRFHFHSRQKWTLGVCLLKGQTDRWMKNKKERNKSPTKKCRERGAGKNWRGKKKQHGTGNNNGLDLILARPIPERQSNSAFISLKFCPLALEKQNQSDRASFYLHHHHRRHHRCCCSFLRRRSRSTEDRYTCNLIRSCSLLIPRRERTFHPGHHTLPSSP